MTEICVHLEAGFKQDAVQIEWPDKVYAYSDVNTDYSIGLARTIHLTPQNETAELKVLILNKELSASVEIAPHRDYAISVNISPEKELTITISNEKKTFF